MMWYLIIYMISQSIVGEPTAVLLGPTDYDTCLKMERQVNHWMQPVIGHCVRLSNADIK